MDQNKDQDQKLDQPIKAHIWGCSEYFLVKLYQNMPFVFIITPAFNNKFTFKHNKKFENFKFDPDLDPNSKFFVNPGPGDIKSNSHQSDK